MTNELGVDITTRDLGDTLSLRGEIDFGNVALLRAALMELASEGLEPVVIDMTGVTFVDSTALSVLVQGKQRLADAGREVTIVNIQPRVLRTVELAGVLDYLQA